MTIRSWRFCYLVQIALLAIGVLYAEGAASADFPQLQIDRSHYRGIRNRQCPAFGLSWNPSGDALAVNDGNGVSLWKIKGLTSRNTLACGSPISEFQWNPARKNQLAADSKSDILLWSSRSMLPVVSLPYGYNTDQGVGFVQWSNSGNLLAVQSLTSELILKPSDRKVIHLFDHRVTNGSQAWSPATDTIAVGLADSIGFWNGRSGKKERSIETGPIHRVETLAWSPDGTSIAGIGTYLSNKYGVAVWSAKTRLCEAVFKHEFGSPFSLAWEPHEKALAIGTNSSVIVWNPKNHRCRVLDTNHAAVNRLAWRPGGRVLAAGTDQGMVFLWNAKTGRLMAKFKVGGGIVEAISWRSQGCLAACSKDGTVKIYTSREPRLMATVYDVGNHGWLIYTQDGRFCASPDALRYVSWGYRGKTWGYQKFQRRFERPNLFQEVMTNTRPHL